MSKHFILFTNLGYTLQIWILILASGSVLETLNLLDSSNFFNTL